MVFCYAGQAWGIVKNRLSVALNGYKEYDGSAEDICQAIIEECWNGKYFQTSLGHFDEFWVRDFGFCVESLLKLGYKEQVERTIRYALDIYSGEGKVTTTISPKGKPFDVFNYGIDSLPFLLRVIRLSGFDFSDYDGFLNKQIKVYSDKVWDKKKGLVKKGYFASIQDMSKKKSSCYANTMVAALASEARELGLNDYFKDLDLRKKLLDTFWNGEYFYDDLKKKRYVSAEANIFPFYMGVVKDKKKLREVVGAIRSDNLDKPFPIKYTAEKKNYFLWREKLMDNYEGTSVWMHMGLLYAALVKKVDKKLFDLYVGRYRKLIERYRNFLEVFDERGRPYKNWIYQADQGMLWAANYLTLR